MKRIAQCTRNYLPDFQIAYRSNNKVVYGTKEDTYDELMMSVTLFDFDGEPAYWVGMDIGNIIPILRDILYQKLKAICPALKKEHFMLSGTHTHEGPEFYKDPIIMGNKLNHTVTTDDLDMRFVDYFTDLAVEMLLECQKKLQPFTAEISITQIEGCYCNRNGLDEPADKDFALLRFRHEKTGELLGLWMNMATHSTLLHPKNLKMSGDLVGCVCELLKGHYGIRPMPVIGCAGDSSTRLIRNRTGNFEDDMKELKRISQSIVNQVIKKEAFKNIRIDRFITKEVELSYKYYIDPIKTKQKMDFLLKRSMEEHDPDRKRLNLSSRRVLMARENETIITEDLIACAVHMGELKWGIFPGELVSSLGLKVIRHKDHDHRLVACYINDKHGYLVEKEKYDSKGFESLAAIIPAGLNEVLTDMVIKELDEFDEEG